ncbi:MAG: hypothetical protein KF868_10495 [Acidobacteria bacterium]|nr:hypothetical protein [Acidobacteriota bacterium]
MHSIITFLPDGMQILGVAAIGLAVIFRFMGIRAATRGLFVAAAILLVSPFIQSFFWSLPLWLMILVAGVVAVVVVRRVALLLLGKDAANEMMGSLAANAVKGVARLSYRMVTFPFRRR